MTPHRTLPEGIRTALTRQAERQRRYLKGVLLAALLLAAILLLAPLKPTWDWLPVAVALAAAALFHAVMTSLTLSIASSRRRRRAARRWSAKGRPAIDFDRPWKEGRRSQ